jgi:hypothetical protein
VGTWDILREVSKTKGLLQGVQQDFDLRTSTMTIATIPPLWYAARLFTDPAPAVTPPHATDP